MNFDLNTGIEFMMHGTFTAPDDNWVHMSRYMTSYELFYVTDGTQMCIRDSIHTGNMARLLNLLHRSILIAPLKIRQKRTGKERILPVSYTHLDVYKRQLYELRVSVADGGAFDLSETEKEINLFA